MARVFVGNRKGNEYMLRDDFRDVCQAMCEISMNFDEHIDSAAENIGARGGVPALRISKLAGGANRCFLIEYGGKKYVVKQTIHKNRENNIKRFIFGSESRKMIISMRKAIEYGGDTFQKTIYIFEFPFFIENRRCTAIWSVSEFIEGDVLALLPNKRDFIGKVLAALSEIARNGIFQTDFYSGNFVVTENGLLKVIDIRISNTPNLALVWKMAYKCRSTFGAPMPTTGFGVIGKVTAFLGDKAFFVLGKRCEFE